MAFLTKGQSVKQLAIAMPVLTAEPTEAPIPVAKEAALILENSAAKGRNAGAEGGKATLSATQLAASAAAAAESQKDDTAVTPPNVPPIVVAVPISLH